jgi:hypothetical protein
LCRSPIPGEPPLGPVVLDAVLIDRPRSVVFGRRRRGCVSAWGKLGAKGAGRAVHGRGKHGHDAVLQAVLPVIDPKLGFKQWGEARSLRILQEGLAVRRTKQISVGCHAHLKIPDRGGLCLGRKGPRTNKEGGDFFKHRSAVLGAVLSVFYLRNEIQVFVRCLLFLRVRVIHAKIWISRIAMYKFNFEFL